MKKILILLLFFTGIANAQIVYIQDTFLKQILTNNTCVDLNADGIGDADADTNNDGEIQVSEAQAVNGLYIGILLAGTMTGLEAFTNLEHLQISYISFSGVLDFTILPQLKTLDCSGTYSSGINITGLTQLEVLTCNGCLVGSLDVSTLTSLKRLNCEENELTALNLSGLNNLEYLNCSNNNLQSLDVGNLTLLTQLICFDNQLTSLNVQGCTALNSIDCYQNQLTIIDFSGLTNLQTAQIMVSSAFDQLLTSVNLSGCIALSNNQIYTSANMTTLNFSGCSSLARISNSFSTIATINLNGCSALTSLNIGNSSFNAIDLTSCTGLVDLSIQFNNLTALDVSGYAALTSLDVSHGTLTSLNVNGCSALLDINISANPLLPTLDLSTCTSLNLIIMVESNLTSLFIKNGRNETISFTGSPNLQYICADESQLETIQQQILMALPNVVMSSYCTFVPGGNYNSITGQAPFDVLGDGCDLSDISNPYIKININDGTNSGSTFTNSTGDYIFYTQTGNFTITPEVENPSFFNISPPNAIINAPVLDNSTQTQNFCVSANGIHPDVEVVFVPTSTARPGFETTYKIIYKNKGNQIVSGTITLNFNSILLDYVESIPNFDTLDPDLFTWNYSNLKPFETRMIELKLLLHTSPEINAGDVLEYVATINPIPGDESPSDNVSNCHHVVVNAHDPNQIVCLEGNTITTQAVGNYLHYNINFENVGNADAINIVVKDTINTAKFNINSLQLQYASHDVETKISGNIIEFIFKNIHLQPSSGPIGGHGNVLFKIRTLPNLVVGDEVMGTANIFFDYNAPIATNEARTTIAALSNHDFIKDESILVAPNPTKGNINITSKNNIKSILLFDVQGRLLQTVLDNKKTTTLDISNYTNGIYFVKVITEVGNSVEKIMKEN